MSAYIAFIEKATDIKSEPRQQTFCPPLYLMYDCLWHCTLALHSGTANFTGEGHRAFHAWKYRRRVVLHGCHRVERCESRLAARTITECTPGAYEDALFHLELVASRFRDKLG
jgi:hypothetical protein